MSKATSSHPDGEAELLEKFNAWAGIGALRPGTNVLAIQGLNTSAGGSDFLISAKLTGSENQSLSPTAVGFSSWKTSRP